MLLRRNLSTYCTVNRATVCLGARRTWSVAWQCSLTDLKSIASPESRSLSRSAWYTCRKRHSLQERTSLTLTHKAGCNSARAHVILQGLVGFFRVEAKTVDKLLFVSFFELLTQRTRLLTHIGLLKTKKLVTCISSPDHAFDQSRTVFPTENKNWLNLTLMPN